MFLVEWLLVGTLAQRSDVDRLEELMVILAHEALATAENIELHSFKCGRNLHRIERLRLFRGEGEHPHFVDGARIEQAEVILCPQRLLEFPRRRIVDIREAFGDRKNLMVEVGLLDSRRAARAARVIGEPVRLQTGVGCRLQQQREILPPIAGDHGVCAGCLDLGNVGGKVGDLQQRVKLVADDLDIRPFRGEHRLGRGANGFSKRIILIDQVNFLDRGHVLYVIGKRFHLDVGIRVPAEMPVAALVVGEGRIDRGIVEVQDFLARIAIIVFGDEIRQRAGDRRTIALSEVANAGIDRFLRLDQAFLRVRLVVERNDFDLLAQNAALGIEFFGNELVRLEADLADAGAAPRQWIDIADLHRFLRNGCSTNQRQRESSSDH